MTGRPLIHKRDGFWLEWFSRRTTLEVNIYIETPDGTRGRLVSELVYPRFASSTPTDWEAEAISIAKREARAK